MTVAISVENLGKTYASGVTALKGISLQVRQGDFFALLGPNGAGKSTFIGILSTLVTKTRGAVQIFGRDVDSHVYQTKLDLGVVPQEINFSQFERVGDIVMTQAGYYGLPSRLAAQRSEKYLRQLGLWDKRGQRSRTLSGGMKRRMMIARALVHEPRLLILDEPTAGVDIELRRSMWDFLLEINRAGTTIVLTTHSAQQHTYSYIMTLSRSPCSSCTIDPTSSLIVRTDVAHWRGSDVVTDILNLYSHCTFLIIDPLPFMSSILYLVHVFRH